MFYQIFLSPQVKQSVIITNKHGIQNLTLRILGNLEISGKFQNFVEFQATAQSLFQNENFVNTKKKIN